MSSNDQDAFNTGKHSQMLVLPWEIQFTIIDKTLNKVFLPKSCRKTYKIILVLFLLYKVSTLIMLKKKKDILCLNPYDDRLAFC